MDTELQYLTGILKLGSGKTFVSDRNTMQRFIEKIEPQVSGCWNWTGSTVKGYGHFRVLTPEGWSMCRTHVYVARVVLQEAAEVIRHKCDNTLCCNPDHLEPGTPKQNAQDCVDRGRVANGNKKTPKHLLESGNLLDEDKVRTIRSLKSQGVKQTQIAKDVGVSPQTVSRVLLGKVWRHVQ